MRAALVQVDRDARTATPVFRGPNGTTAEAPPPPPARPLRRTVVLEF
jgi:hypothetical protein